MLFCTTPRHMSGPPTANPPPPMAVAAAHPITSVPTPATFAAAAAAASGTASAAASPSAYRLAAPHHVLSGPVLAPCSSPHVPVGPARALLPVSTALPSGACPRPSLFSFPAAATGAPAPMPGSTAPGAPMTSQPAAPALASFGVMRAAAPPAALAAFMASQSFAAAPAPFGVGAVVHGANPTAFPAPAASAASTACPTYTTSAAYLAAASAAASAAHSAAVDAANLRTLAVLGATAPLAKAPNVAPKPTLPKPPPRPAVPPRPLPPSNLPGERLEVQLSAPHGIREPSGALVLDKRVFSINVRVLDGNGVWTSPPLGLQCTLMFEDGEALPPEVQQSALFGTTAHLTTKGDHTFKLRATVVSSNYNQRRFHVHVAPQDQGLASAHPKLTVHTEPFTLKYSITKKQEPAPKPKLTLGTLGTSMGTGGPVPTISKASISKLGSAPVDTGGGAGHSVGVSTATLARRRYFPAQALKAATAAAPGAPSAPLARSAVAICDRLAAMVAQQLTNRAWQHARRKRAGTRELRPTDVGAIVRRGGIFDFLDQVGVTAKWIEETSTTPSATAPSPARPAPPPMPAPPAMPAPPPMPAPPAMPAPPPMPAPAAILSIALPPAPPAPSASLAPAVPPAPAAVLPAPLAPPAPSAAMEKAAALDVQATPMMTMDGATRVAGDQARSEPSAADHAIEEATERAVPMEVAPNGDCQMTD